MQWEIEGRSILDEMWERGRQQTQCWTTALVCNQAASLCCEWAKGIEVRNKRTYLVTVYVILFTVNTQCNLNANIYLQRLGSI